MPTDHPDGTYPVAFIMADIMMPVDIQAQFVTLDVDITAQSIGNLNIDIAAQTIGNLDVNIAASAVTINVAVTGTANIDITAQSVGVYLQAEWSALQGYDKNFECQEANVAVDGDVSGTYNVPAGKTLFLCGLSFEIHGYAAADRDLNQIGRALIYNSTDAIRLVDLGGNGGNGVPLPKPATIPGGKQLRYYGYNETNHAVFIRVTTWGYEI